MKREELKKLLGEGADEKVIDAIMALHGSDLESHKTTATKAGDDLKAVQGQLEEAKKQIKSFEDMKPEDLKKAVGDWETKYKELETQHANETKQRTFEAALEKGLTAAKVKDVVAVKAHLKLDGLKLNEDGTFVGLKEQLEPLQKEKDYLFEPAGDGEEEEIPSIVTGAKGTPTKTSTFEAALLKGAGLKEWPQE